MAKIINSNWASDMVNKIAGHQHIDVTTRFIKAVQFLIEQLSRANTPFKIYNLGAGVRRITTDTDRCPCCKQALRGGEVASDR